MGRQVSEIVIAAPAATLRERAVKYIRNFARRKPLGFVSVLVLLFMVLVAVFADVITPYDPKASEAGRLETPSLRHPMGSDDSGRDLLSRVIAGSRISLSVGFTAVLIGTTLGSLLGIISGYFGGLFDLVFQRVMDAIQTIPLIVLAITLVAILTPSIANVTGVLAFGLLARSSRIARGSVIGIKESQYVEAAKAIGVSTLRMLLRYIIPNVMAPIIVVASVTLGSTIIAESSLSFLGLGVPPPAISWGMLLGSSGRQHMVEAPWIAILPGFAITITVLSFNLLGDAIRDVLDPRLRS